MVIFIQEMVETKFVSTAVPNQIKPINVTSLEKIINKYILAIGNP